MLAETFVIRVLPPWFDDLKKRQAKSPKVYLRDSGVLHWLLGIDSVRLDFLSVIREVMRWKP